MKKPYKSLCVIIDFYMVNKNIISDAYPIHCIDKKLESMIESKVSTTLDLTKGYYKIELNKNSIETTVLLFSWFILIKSFTYGNENF